MEPQPFPVARELLEEARKQCPKSWRLVPVNAGDTEHLGREN